MKALKTKLSRIGKVLLAVCLLFTSLGIPAGGGTAQQCPNHPQHDAACGYAAPVEAQPCSHQHDAACGWAEAPAEQPCQHAHDAGCGYTQAAAESPCTHTCETCAPDAAKNLKQISAFERLDAEDAKVTADTGTALADLMLPKILLATVNGVPAELPVKAWRAKPNTPAYDPDAAGDYLLVPAFDEGYVVADGVTLPEITVTLTARPIVLLGNGADNARMFSFSFSAQRGVGYSTVPYNGGALYSTYNSPNMQFILPCDVIHSAGVQITNVSPEDLMGATYTITHGGAFVSEWGNFEGLGLQQYYKSTAYIYITAAGGSPTATYTITFYARSHNLEYALVPNSNYEIQQSCENFLNGYCMLKAFDGSPGLKATAKLLIEGGPFPYTGSACTPAYLVCTPNWYGPQPTIQYVNNINVGTAKAYITVGGTPDSTVGSVTAYQYFSIVRGVQAAPTTPAGVAETIYGKADGKITGVSTAMEYSRQADSGYMAISGTTIENLVPGEYFVRYRATGNYNASPPIPVGVGMGRHLIVTFLTVAGPREDVYSWHGSVDSLPEIPERQGYDQVDAYWDKTLAELQNLEKDVTVNAVYTRNLYTVELVNNQGYTLEAVSGSASPVAYEGSFTFKLTLAPEFSKESNFAVMVNNLPVVLNNDDTYTISNISSDQVVTVTGVGDHVPPTATVQYKTNGFKSFLNSMTFGLFFKKNVDVAILATDLGIGVKSIQYHKASAPVPNPQSITDWTHGSSFSVTQNEKFFLYVKVADWADNMQISYDGVVVYTDSAAVTAGIGYTLTSNQDQTAFVTLNGNTVAGIQNGTATLLNGIDYTVSGNAITFKAGYLENLAAGPYSLTVSYNPLGETYVSGGNNELPADTSIMLTVLKAAQTLSLSGYDLAYDYGDSPFDLILSGKLSSAAASYEIAEGAGVASLSGNKVTILKAGTFKVKVTAPADGKYAEASVTSALITVHEARPVVALTGADVDYGQQVTLHAAVSRPAGSTGADPAGTVTFKEGNTVLAANVPLVNGAANYTTTITPGIAMHRYSVEYAGQPDYYTVATSAVNVAVRGVTSVRITPDSPVVVRGNTLQLTAAVDAVGNVDKGVKWRVISVDPMTTISRTGLLTVGPAETEQTLIVTAISNFDRSKYDTVTVTVQGITALRLTPQTTAVVKGQTAQFTAAVDVMGNASKGVTWRVTGGNDPKTQISATGLLTVGPTETAPTLTVTATSVPDTTKNDTAIVTVNDVPFGFEGGSVHRIDSGTDLLFGVDKNFSLYNQALVDGKALTGSQHTVASGSTKVKLNAAYLSTLSPGDHSLTVAFSDGYEADATFTVTAADSIADGATVDGTTADGGTAGTLSGDPGTKGPGEAGLERITDNIVPLAAPNSRAWSLVNLIIALLTVLGAGFMLRRYLGRRRGARLNRQDIWRLAGLLPGIGAIVAFLLTQNLSGQTALLDKWTPLMAAIALIQVGAIILTGRMGRKSGADA